MRDTAIIDATAPDARIDPKAVPDYAYRLICADLRDALTLARRNPEYRARFEAWRAART